jgi:hypothetical protein
MIFSKHEAGWLHKWRLKMTRSLYGDLEQPQATVRSILWDFRRVAGTYEAENVQDPVA